MDKIDRLLDALEHPERYSSAEIDEMLQDPETKEVFDLLDKAKSSLQPVSTPDVEAEWEAFKVKNLNVKKSLRSRFAGLFSRKVAASIAIGITALTAVAALVGIGVHYSFGRQSDSEIGMVKSDVAIATVSQGDTVVTLNDTVQVPAETVVFDNESFETIISKIAAYYGYEVIYVTDSPKSLRLYYRWKQSLPLEDIVESLNNFGQIHLSIKGKTIKVD